MTKDQLVIYVRQRGEYLTGGQRADVVVAEWLDGLTVTQAHEYMEAGTFQVWAARAMQRAGYSAHIAGQVVDIYGTRMTIGEALSNGDIDLKHIPQMCQ